MASIALDMTRQWAGQLADVTDHVMKELPEKEDWGCVRHFLTNTSRLLRKGDLKSGVKAVLKILPFVQRAVSNVEKYKNIHMNFDATESVSRHFLVDDSHKENIENFMIIIHSNVKDLKKRVEKLVVKLDTILEDVIEKGESLGWWQGIKLAFEINRISALVKTCEDHLKTARDLLDELDSHVAGKSFLAYAFTYISLLVGLVFSASGNVPVGAACISAATATRKAAKSLDHYRKQLSEIDSNHIKLQSELIEWKNRFTAEKTNFILLFGPVQGSILIILFASFLVLVGKPGNCVVFAIISMLILFKAHISESNSYTVAILVAIAAVWFEYQHMWGLFAFNMAAFISALANYIGLIEFWW